VDGSVPREPVGLGFEYRAGPLGPPGVLDDGVWERLDGPTVEVGIRGNVDAGPLVVALQVGDADPPGVGEVGEQRLVPVGLGVELERHFGIDVEEGLDPVHRLDARADDEPNRIVVAVERPAEARVGLPEREVERRALDGPPPVVPRDFAGRPLGPQLHPVEMRRELADRPLPDERVLERAVVVGRGERVVVLHLVGDVLAGARLAPAVEPEFGRGAGEIRPGRPLVPAAVVPLDDERQVGEAVVETHGGDRPGAGISPRVGRVRSRKRGPRFPGAAGTE